MTRTAYCLRVSPAPPIRDRRNGCPAAEAVGSDGLWVTAPVRQGTASLGTVFIEAFPDPIRRRAARYGFVALIFTLAALMVGVLAAGSVGFAKGE